MKGSAYRVLFLVFAVLVFVAAAVFFITTANTNFLKPGSQMIDTEDAIRQENAPVKDTFEPGQAVWTLASQNAPFAERDSHSLVVFKDKLWLLGGVGGTAPVYKPNYNDIWVSENGSDWTLAVESAPWPGRRSHGAVVFNGKIWIFGGITDNDKYLNDVWVSDDGINWQKVQDNAGWSPRKGFASAVFDNKIWVMGGIDSRNARNDVWHSTDGITWTLAAAKAEWSPRIGPTVEVFDGKIWISGGNYPDEMGQSDIWQSTDGTTWTLAANAPWPGRHCHCFISYNNYLWVIGGWSGYAHGYNDVWYSADGINWEPLYKDGKEGGSPWKGREDLACAEFDGKIYMAGGMKTNGERMNDVWQLSENKNGN